jgi:hypothetical protein
MGARAPRGLVLLVAGVLGAQAEAHAMRSAYVEIAELGGGHVSVQVRESRPAPGFKVEPPPGCVEDVFQGTDDGLRLSAVWTCDGPLVGRLVAVSGLGPILTEAVVDVSLSDGRTATHLVRGESATWTIPAVETPWRVFREYLRLGVVHILTGGDHLLFLFLLVLALQRPRAVFFAETAFTLSHTLSFSASALGWIRLSSAAAEACIALSLVLMAWDAGRPGRPLLSARQGAAMALVFGCVHGLGFAGGLREIGLPEKSVPFALASFGLGVEAGQVAFLIAVLSVVLVASRWRQWSRIAAGSTVLAGGVGTYWLLARLSLLVAG